MEKVEELWPGGYKILQDDTLFKLGTDSVLLSAFPKISGRRRVCDLGCGTGALLILLAARNREAVMDGVEIIPEAAQLARRNVLLNGLQNRINIVTGDLRMPPSSLARGGYDLVISNPPYFSKTGGRKPSGEALANSRAEYSCTIDDICKTASLLLRPWGFLSVVFRTERLIDLYLSMRKSGIEPKRERLVYYRKGYPPAFALVEGRRGGKASLTIEPPFFMHNEDGSETDEMKSVYKRPDEC